MPEPQRQLAPALHGLIRLSGISIALSAEAIREVVPRPEELIPFPTLIPQLSGAIALRGQIIPVLDLEQLLDPHRPARLDAASIVVVLRHEDMVYGISASRIEGVSALGAEALGSLQIASNSLAHRLVKQTFVHNGMSGVVIDPAALAQLPGLPLAQDLAGQDSNRQKAVEQALIFQIGGLHLALPAACVDASLPAQRLLPAPVADDLWIAMLQHNGIEIPVIDTLALLQHGSLGHRTSGSAVVLRVAAEEASDDHDYGLVALLIDSVEDIVRPGPGLLAPLDGNLGQTPFVQGIVGLECGPCLILDGQRMSTDPRLKRLGKVQQQPEQDTPAKPVAGTLNPLESDSGETERTPYLVFTVGAGSFAAPLSVIDEILARDEATVPLETSGHAISSLISRRGRTVPILDLARCLGATGGHDDQFLVIVRIDSASQPNRIGFAVDALRSVEKASVQRLHPANGTAKAPALGLLETTIRLEDGKACSVLDLPQLALSALAAREAA